ncbi:hypothetical protein [Streptomyces nigrescens]|uniref:hypothetical protein n=1 Tax=Streptomyces nigrescens TaxID=1920 RepID=UPI0037006D59
MTTRPRPRFSHRILTAVLTLLSGRNRRKAPKPEALAAEFDQQLLDAADAAISLARRALYDVVWPQLPPRERLHAFGEVTVENVTELMHLHYGIAAIPPERAAAALRARYEARSGRMDLTTDAYPR